TQPIIAATGFLVVVDEAGNEKIELAVLVIIEPDGAGGPSGRRDSGFLSYVCESAVAVVVIENVPTIAGNVKIGAAVAVVITRGCAHTKRAARNSGFFSNIGKGAVVIVAIEG